MLPYPRIDLSPWRTLIAVVFDNLVRRMDMVGVNDVLGVRQSMEIYGQTQDMEGLLEDEKACSEYMDATRSR